jgi:WD40 repeat protein
MTKQKTKRIRGLILSRLGWQKLQSAKAEWEFAENQGYKITLEEIAERSSLTTATIRKILTRNEGVDRRSIAILFSALNLELTNEDCTKPNPQKELGLIDRKIDWGEAIDVSVFFGRTRELETLARWMGKDRCRLISMIGIGGVGKTTLSIKITQQVESNFTSVIWRSLRDAPPIHEFLLNLIQFFSEQPVVGKDIPESVPDKITLLINCLRASRCLVIFDNIESLMCDDNRAGICADEYQEYDQLFERLAASEHQSCVLLTTREKPQAVIPFEGETSPVRSLKLDGLQEQEGEAILQQKGLKGSAAELANLVERYNGNPLALKIVGTTIRDLFESDITSFLRQDMVIFGDINELLNQQFRRLLNIENRIMYWLAINREPITLEQLQADLVDSSTQPKLIDGLESLVRRCLIEKAEYSAGDDSVRFTLQSVVMEYVTNKLIQEICQEINTQEIELFRFYALVKATAKDYIKEAQKRLILESLIARLLDLLGCQGNIEQRLLQLKSTLQSTSPNQTGYVAGNILNLLCYLETDLTGVDFSNLCIWQADLQNVCLHDVSFQNSNFAKTVFRETFGGVLSVAFSLDGQYLATGDTNGEIRLRKVADGQQTLIYKGHTNWVTSLAFSQDGTTLASSSIDYTVKLWDVATGQCFKTFTEHDDEVWSVVFSPDGNWLASGSDDCTVKLWNIDTSECIRTFQEHTSWVSSVTFSLDGQNLLSGSDDCTVKLWNIDTSECIRTFYGHQDGIRSITISPDGNWLASGSEDQTVRLWNIDTSECIRTFHRHSNEVYSVAFSPKGDLIASSSFDQTVRLWNIDTSECIRTFHGHTSWIFSIVFNPKGDLIASGSFDQTVKLWNLRTSECRKTFCGHTNQIFSVAFSPDGRTLASGSHDRTVRLWDVSTGQVLQTFQGHSAAVRSVAFSPDGLTLASSSDDRTVRLWNVSTGQVLQTFQGHSAAVWSVAFSPDGLTLASAALDHKIRLWNVTTGECKSTLKDHNNWVLSVAFSTDNELLSSSSYDGTIKLWRVKTGECYETWQENTGWLKSIAFSPDTQILANSSSDYTVKLWNINTNECCGILKGHTGRVWSVAISPSNQILASSGDDETIRLWNITTGKCFKSLKSHKPYERTNIKGVTGLTEGAIATLQALGANNN